MKHYRQTDKIDQRDVHYRRIDKIEQRAVQNSDHPDRRYYRARISNQNKDSHDSIMDASTLKNFASDAADGVNILDSHNHQTVGVGESTSGEYNSEEGSVYSDFYILKDLNLNNQSFPNTDDLIKAIDDGFANKVSVGFGGGNHICNICSEDIWYGKCGHWPGEEYEVGTDDNKEMTTCYALIKDANLYEFSIVYAGATPGAEIVKKAKHTSSSLDPKQKESISAKYGVDFNKLETKMDPKRQLDPNTKRDPKDPKPINLKTRSNLNMTSEERVKQLETDVELLTQRAEKAEAEAVTIYEERSQKKSFEKRLGEAEKRVETLVKLHTDEIERAEKAENELAEVKPRANAYDTLLEEEIAEALKLRLAAYPEQDEESEQYKRSERILKKEDSISGVRDYKDEWTEKAEENFPGGQQIPNDPEENKKELPQPLNNIPNEAYQ